MSRRIDIELTSALADGSWTWRAAGARQPKGVVDGAILPPGAKVGDELKVEVEQELDGLTVLGVVQGRARGEREVIELLPVERDFQPVVEHRAGGRSDRTRRPRSDRDRGRDDRRGSRGEGRDRSDRKDRGDRRERGRDGERRERRGPSFTPPPEVPQRPKPKRLRPGKEHRTAVLAELPEEQRPIAELTLQGMGAVRQRLREENERAASEGRPPMPEATVLKMAEELLPKLRVAEWLDRAEAAKRQIDQLDLRDVRSVVAASEDPIVARDESTRSLSAELKEALATKQAQELQLWYADVDAALAVGRVIRALRLSSQPPKAGVPFPTDIAQRLADSTNAALTPIDSPDRWAATLEAAAFSPIRTMVQPTHKPDTVTDELLATVKRLAPALPHVAALFEIEVAPNAPMPKPLRVNPRQKPGAKPGTKPSAQAGSKTTGQSEGKQQGRQAGQRKPKAAKPDAEGDGAAETASGDATPATTGATGAAHAAPDAGSPATNEVSSPEAGEAESAEARPTETSSEPSEPDTEAESSDPGPTETRSEPSESGATEAESADVQGAESESDGSAAVEPDAQATQSEAIADRATGQPTTADAVEPESAAPETAAPETAAAEAEVPVADPGPDEAERAAAEQD